ncbi:hypothetical protein OROHE_001984 [Orobanche hederae]
MAVKSSSPLGWHQALEDESGLSGLEDGPNNADYEEDSEGENKEANEASLKARLPLVLVVVTQFLRPDGQGDGDIVVFPLKFKGF